MESHKGSTVKTISSEEMQGKYLVLLPGSSGNQDIAGKLPEEIEQRKWMSVWSRWEKLQKERCTTLCVMMNSFIHALFRANKVRNTI